MDVDLECVFESTNPALLAVVKSLLEDAGIDYLSSGDAQFSVLPVLPVRIEVDHSRAEEARALLEDLESADEPDEPTSPTSKTRIPRAEARPRTANREPRAASRAYFFLVLLPVPRGTVGSHLRLAIGSVPSLPKGTPSLSSSRFCRSGGS